MSEIAPLPIVESKITLSPCGIQSIREKSDRPIQIPTQPPLRWHFDPQVLEVEQRILFEQGFNYVGHELLVPNPGDYHVPSQLNNAKILVRNQHGVELLSNICRHRQAIMLEGRGTVKNIVCPLHRWSYRLDGTMLGAPHFPENPCLHLNKTPLQNWNGLLFASQRNVAKDLAAMPALKELDFSNYLLNRVEVEEYAFNWKTFIEAYQEDYHVEPFHPGLGKFVDCNDLHWKFGDWYCLQTVGVQRDLRKVGSATYGKWQEQVQRYHHGDMPRFGAIWLTLYPNIMIEWYPGTLVVSSVIPNGTDACTHIAEFYYLEDIVLFERDFIAAEKAAYHETAKEDNIICQKIHQGRKYLYQQGLEESGPYQSPTEDGLQHFHEFLLRQLTPHVK